MPELPPAETERIDDFIRTSAMSIAESMREARDAMERAIAEFAESRDSR